MNDQEYERLNKLATADLCGQDIGWLSEDDKVKVLCMKLAIARCAAEEMWKCLGQIKEWQYLREHYPWLPEPTEEPI